MLEVFWGARKHVYLVYTMCSLVRSMKFVRFEIFTEQTMKNVMLYVKPCDSCKN
jgi:hypothetical protein